MRGRWRELIGDYFYALERLEEVWGAAAHHGAGLGLRSYGVIVARASDGKFLVAAEGGNPEREFTQYVCR